MRPQHITAENMSRMSRDGVRAFRFNEAAAYHCGKPGVMCTGVSIAGRLQ